VSIGLGRTTPVRVIEVVEEGAHGVAVICCELRALFWEAGRGGGKVGVGPVDYEEVIVSLNPSWLTGESRGGVQRGSEVRGRRGLTCTCIYYHPGIREERFGY
jgi:hypothetical protein